MTSVMDRTSLTARDLVVEGATAGWSSTGCRRVTVAERRVYAEPYLRCAATQQRTVSVPALRDHPVRQTKHALLCASLP